MKVAIVILAVMVGLLIGCMVGIVIRLIIDTERINMSLYEIEREQKRVDHVLDWVRDVIKKNQLS